ncbi:transcriptional regulator [Vibrio phage ICP1]|nr:transcriptional regulator [Vibrio phage ICP1]
MKNEAHKFDHQVFGELQVVVYEDKPHFIANEVSDILGYKQHKDGRAHCKSLIKLSLPDLRKLGLESLATNPQGIIICPEKDVYRMVMRSNLPKAEEFQDWVMEEVLPTIRKTGGFVSDVDQIIDTFYKDEKEDIKAIIRASLVFRKENQHKIDFANDVTETVGWQDMNSVAKVLGLGRNTLFRYLREIGILMDNNLPYQQYITQGYFRVNPVTKYGRQFNVTLVSGKGEVWVHKKLKEHNLI